MKSSVWSFAVTLWEILTFAREQPFEDLADEKIIENAKLFEKANGKPVSNCAYANNYSKFSFN